MNTAIAKPWLTLQCQMIPGVRHAVFASDLTPDGTFATLEHWPLDVVASDTILKVLNTVVTSGKAEVCTRRDPGGFGQGDTWIVACPLRRAGVVCGATAVEVGGIDEAQLPVITRLMEWGSAWPAFIADRDAEHGTEKGFALEAVVGAALESVGFQAAATAAATALIGEHTADNAVIGWVNDDKIKLAAMSGRAVFDQRSDNARVLEDALGEAFDQGATVVCPAQPTNEPQITVAHEQIAAIDRCVCTVLMGTQGKTVGGLLISRAADRPFTPQEIEQLHQLANLLGPALEARRLAEKGGLSRMRDSVTQSAQRLFGRGQLSLKIASLGALGLLAFLALANGTHYVSAPAVLEGTVQRDLVAPIDGFVAVANVRAGARVRAGELLATLDDKPLRLERGRLEGHRDELASEYDRALGVLDHGATKILGAQMRQAESQLALVEEQLSRINIVAPFDALVVQGDLSQSVGSPVSRGDILFSLAPLEGYRVILDVEENDVPAVKTGAVGQLVLAALPRERFEVRVERLNGMTRSSEGLNVLEVESELIGASEQLRPGMRGVVRVDVGEARLLWIWTHRLTERVSLWWWAWSPVA